MFSFNELTLTHFLPMARTHFETWLQYFIVRDAIYDAMFFISFIVLYWALPGIGKSIAAFGVFLTGGSFIDKVIFGLNQYLYSDIILVIMALLFSLYVYKRYGRSKKLVT